MSKVAVYYRVSTNKQDFESQKQEIEAYLSQHNPESVVVYSDHGISGKASAKRPEFERMLLDAQSGEFDTIVVYKLDRFSRDANTAIRTILDLDDQGVAFISVTQPVLNLGHNNPFRRTMLSAFAEIAQIERETTVSRIRAGLDAARKRGVKLGAKKKITPEQSAKIIELVHRKFTYRDISRATGVSLGSVSSIVRTSGRARS